MFLRSEANSSEGRTPADPASVATEAYWYLADAKLTGVVGNVTYDYIGSSQGRLIKKNYHRTRQLEESEARALAVAAVAVQYEEPNLQVIGAKRERLVGSLK